MHYCLIVFMLILSSVSFADDDDDDKTASKSVTASSVNLTANTQQRAGIQTLKLTPVQFQAEHIVFGKVLSVQPLFELRQRYLTALSEKNSAKARLTQAQQQTERQQQLYQVGITAKRNVEEQQTQLTVQQSAVEAVAYQDSAIKNQALLTWGKTLSAWALSDSHKLDAYLSGDKQLLQITLTSQQTLNSNSIAVARSGEREKAVTAQLISLAPQTDNTQGQSYFFQTQAKTLSVGMAVTAWLPEQNDIKTGVMLPKSALLWVMDQAFVYIKTADGQFSRRALSHYQLSKDGYFTQDVAATEELVTVGAQMLLSEELRGQIPDED